MLTYRSFRNFDPPLLTSLWRSRAGQFGLVQPVSPDLLEQLVFAKTYFDYGGLWLAFDGAEPVGFAHAGFGPNPAESAISTDVGVTCLVLVRPGCAEADVAAGLVERCEDYLRRRGATVLQGGGAYPINPFYVGLYGGSELPGVLDSDTVARGVFAARGYEEVARTSILRRELGGFEPLVDRQQMQVRRQMLIEVTADAPSRTWWEACTLGEFDVTRFEMVSRVGGSRVASALFRSIESSGSAALGRAAGLIEIKVEPSYRGRGLATFLLSEAFRQFLRQGIMHVEAQVPANNEAGLGLFQRFGFSQVAQGGIWRKDA
jgi:GNAT superfamily N-acetyltransferase